METEALVADIRRVEAGGGMSPMLTRIRDSFSNTIMDDSLVEGPHASAAQIGAHAHASKWPFDAATMRIKGQYP